MPTHARTRPNHPRSLPRRPTGRALPPGGPDSDRDEGKPSVCSGQAEVGMEGIQPPWQTPRRGDGGSGGPAPGPAETEGPHEAPVVTTIRNDRAGPMADQAAARPPPPPPRPSPGRAGGLGPRAARYGDLGAARGVEAGVLQRLVHAVVRPVVHVSGLEADVAVQGDARGAPRVVAVGRVHLRRRADPEALRPALAALGAGQRENGGCCEALARFGDGPLVGEGALRRSKRRLVDGRADGEGGDGLCGVDWDRHALEGGMAERSEPGGVAAEFAWGGAAVALVMLGGWG
eukprot:CAMPEP_0172163010 /NCGR_PEP_ID=MMETSP1050-20130122/7027_1 /TAXON_ID=233186 /ORGANISM="Cryptomonas curvata, Strain CCAP979/52" /LENGTH=288 /DNA_ID=CAMNT_0012833139 /DNA_START=191 /DNA_END=1061 /DNA_ORIENTATION=+